MLSTEQQQKAIGALLARKENSLCADCNGKSPCWVSLDFGVFVCMNCSGAHRSLGPSITRVRSTKLDTWNRAWLENMQIGNTVLNEYWEHELTGVSRSAKPNINTSLNDIIKFVQDKYVKKKYADPKEPLDPLKRAKMGLPPQPLPTETPPQTKPKEPVKVQSKPAQVAQKESPFAIFDNIAKEKRRRKSSDNLISFEEHAAKKTESGNLVGFDFPLPDKSNEPKYEKSQFHTMGGGKVTPSSGSIDFQSLLRAKQAEKSTHNNYLLQSPGHSTSTSHHISQSTPQFDRSQYVTMNINMNMYPKVMNVNHYQLPPQPPHHPHTHYHPQTHYPHPQTHNNAQFATNGGFGAQNGLFAGQGGLAVGGGSGKGGLNITLDANINLDTIGKDKAATVAPTSWIDDWK